MFELLMFPYGCAYFCSFFLEFPGTEQICPSEIAVESCLESEDKENEESSSYSSENNLSASTSNFGSNLRI